MTHGSAGLTRRERRLAATRAHRRRGLTGWFGYGGGVAGLIVVTAFFALGAAPSPTPAPVARTSTPGPPPAASVSEVTPTTQVEQVTPSNPAMPSSVATSSTTITAPPVVVAAATPETSTPTP